MDKNFWDIMFNELDKTTAAEWEEFVEAFDAKYYLPVYEFEIKTSMTQEVNIVDDILFTNVDSELMTLAA